MFAKLQLITKRRRRTEGKMGGMRDETVAKPQNRFGFRPHFRATRGRSINDICTGTGRGIQKTENSIDRLRESDRDKGERCPKC